MAVDHGPVGEFPINSKIIAITGGGSGIGLALAQSCHSKGAKVIIGDIKLTGEAEQFLAAESGNGNLVYVKCNVADWKDLKNLVNVSLEKWGDVPDVYAPVAGIFEPKWSNLWDDTEDEQGYYATMRINAEHPAKLTRIAIRALLGADKKGVVCLVSSGAGLGGIYLSALYCASKHAVIGLVRSLAPADEQEGVKVVCMCPGLVLSPLLTDRSDDKEKMLGYHGADAKDNRPHLAPSDIAESMLRLIEQGQHRGGTIMSRRPVPSADALAGETIVEEGGKEIYPTEGTFVRDLLAKERGVPWKTCRSSSIRYPGR